MKRSGFALAAVSLALSLSLACGGHGGPSPGSGPGASGGVGATASAGRDGGGAATGGRPGSGGVGAGGAIVTATGGTAPAGSFGGAAATGGMAGTGGGSGGAKATGAGGDSAGATGGSPGSGGHASGGAGRGGGGTAGAGGKPASEAPGGAGGGTSGPAAPGPVEDKPTGYGQGTTGGGSAQATTVKDMATLQAAIDAYSGSGGLVLTYTGRFDFSSITDPCTQWHLPAQTIEIKKKSDITIMGADGSTANFGIHVASSSSNVIIRNMTFGLLPGGDASDAISVEGMSSGFPTDLWIDHNELFSSMAECSGAGDASFDGLIDLKKGADRVTVSYNYLHDHHKVSLNGFSDGDDAVRHITFHHNVFENVGSRTPLQRHGYSHLFNNVFTRIATSGINVRMGGYSLVEANYFQDVENPVTSRDSDALGDWELRGNNVTGPADFQTYGITFVPSSSSPSRDATDWVTTAAFPVPLGYGYTADPAACLSGNLKSVAGAGKHLATLKCR